MPESSILVLAGIAALQLVLLFIIWKLVGKQHPIQAELQKYVRFAYKNGYVHAGTRFPELIEHIRKCQTCQKRMHEVELEL